MVKDVEELRREIEQFEDNMKRSNGMIDLLGDGIERLNRNYEELRELSKEVQTTNDSFIHNVELLRSDLQNCDKELNTKVDQNVVDMRREIYSLSESINKTMTSFCKEVSAETKRESEQLKQKLDSLEINLGTKIKKVNTFAIISCIIAAISLVIALVR